MDNLDEIQLGTKRIFEGKMINLRVDTVRLPNSKEAIREVVEHPGAVAVVPILPDGRVIMVRQYRYPIKQNLLEIPAGKLDKNEQPEDCAIRELEEETGYRAAMAVHLSSFYLDSGQKNSRKHLFYAKDAVLCGIPSDNEGIKVRLCPIQQVYEKILDGGFVEPSLAVAVLFLKAKFS